MTITTTDTLLSRTASSVVRAVNAGENARADILAFLFGEKGAPAGLAADLIVAACMEKAGARPSSTTEYQNGALAGLRSFFVRTGVIATFNKRKGGQCAVAFSDTGTVVSAANAMLRTLASALGHLPEVAPAEAATEAAPEAAPEAGKPAPKLGDLLAELFTGFTPVAIAEAMAADRPGDAGALCAALIAAGMAPAGTKASTKASMKKAI